MIKFTQGDTPVLQLTATQSGGAPFNLSGAVFTSYVKDAKGNTHTIPDDQHEADADQSTNTGQFTLSLTAADTRACGKGEDKELITKVVQGGSVVHFRGVKLFTVLGSVPEA